MPGKSVKLLIDSQDVALIKAAQQRITLGKAVSSSVANVIWLSIEPGASTEVSWQEEYGIYVTTAQVADGSSIHKLAETAFPATDGAYYALTPANVFNGPFSGGSVPAGTLGAHNDVPYSAHPSLTFGLTQSALVNHLSAERKPLSAVTVLATQCAQMTSLPIVYVWLESQFVSETIISKIVGKSTKITFGAGIDSVTLKYDPKLGLFVPSANAKDRRLLVRPPVELLGLQG
jgi:hypothetical protein